MSDYTRDGARPDTKITKVTKTTNNYWVFVILVVFVIFVPERQPWRVTAQAPQAGQSPTQAQQRPVFRGGTHFVRVDAYPTTPDGKIVEGLKPEDFEILEDGKPQAIESFDFLKFDTFTPEAERRDPVSQRAGFDMAADPRYRLFVVYVDMALSTSAGAFSSDVGTTATGIRPVTVSDDLPRIRQPLVDFFNRIVGPQDLYGFLTSRNSVKDLVLGQKTAATVEQVLDLWRAKAVDRDDADDALGFCSCGAAEKVPQICTNLMEALKLRHRADATYNNLQDIVRQLGSLRQERKNFVLLTNLLPRWRPDQSLLTTRGPVSPRSGIVNGRVTGDDRNVYTNAGGGEANACAQEFSRLALMDFEPRYRELLDAARRENVSFYVITPGGLQAPPALGDQRAMRAAYDDLKSLAENTGGIAVTDTNDLNAAFRRIADDLAAYYLLGYYTTNTKFDGGLRKITVRLKTTRKAIRARSEYRAPTEAEIAAMASPAPAPTRVESGPPAVIGEPVAYRVTRAEGAQKVSPLEFARTDRIRVQWPVLAALDRREARLLDSAGKPLPVDIPVAEDAAGKTATVEFALAPLSRGVYSLELTAGAGGKTESRRVTFMMK
jgi:VWFA-related protein